MEECFYCFSKYKKIYMKSFPCFSKYKKWKNVFIVSQNIKKSI